MNARVRVLPSPYLRRAGESGEVVHECPDAPYPVFVRFADGVTAWFRRDELAIGDEPAPAVEPPAPAPCLHVWAANPGLLDFDDPDPAPFACHLCGAAGAPCPRCGGHGIVPTGRVAVVWARPEAPAASRERSSVYRDDANGEVPR